MQTEPKIDNQSFNTFPEAVVYATSLLKDRSIYPARVWLDRFESCRPKTHEAKLLGFSKQAAAFCKKVVPQGKFVVCAEPVTAGYHLSCWYDRYLPYAYAMMQCENGFEHFGISHSEVNAFFGTVCGFNYLGQDNLNLLHADDAALYQKLYNAACRVRPPSLPFDEAHFPAVCYVYYHFPKLVAKECGWWAVEAQKVLELCDLKPSTSRVSAPF